MRNIIVGLFAVLAMGASAHAEDLSAQPGYDWSGFYVGVHGGWEAGRFSGPFQNSGQTLSGPYDFTRNGALIGAVVGYNYQMGSIVLGVDADLNVAAGVEGTSYNVPFAGGLAFYDIGGKQTWSGDVRLKVGAAVGRFMPYLAGGVAFGDVQTNYANAGLAPTLSMITQRVGWTVGIGANYAVSDHLFVGLEYKYTDLGSKDFTNIPQVVHDNVKFRSNEVLATLAYKF